MAVVLSGKEVGLTKVSVDVKLPENATARLMYYLHCINSVLCLETTEYNIPRLTDYQNYYMLTNDEKVELLSLCKKLSPDKLNNKCIFHSDKLCGDSENRIFRLTSTETALVAAESVFIGATKVSVKRFMAYKMSWIKAIYTNPMAQCICPNTERRENQRAITSNNRPAIQTRTITPPVHRNTTRNNAKWIYSSNSSSLDCCTIL